MSTCVCGALQGDPEQIDERPDCPVHGEAVSALPVPAADLGWARLELMGHRYRAGHLFETVVAGTPFLQLELLNGNVELYRPDAIYCLTPMNEAAVRLEAAPRPALAAYDPDIHDLEEDPF